MREKRSGVVGRSFQNDQRRRRASSASGVWVFEPVAAPAGPAAERGACLAAQIRLLESGWIQPDEQVVLFNTGTGLKYAHLWA